MMPFGSGCCGGYGGFGSFGIWGLILNAVFGLLIFGGLIWLTVWAIRRFTARNTGGSNYNPAAPSESAKEIARMRYARGEITREQYQEILNDLSR